MLVYFSHKRFKKLTKKSRACSCKQRYRGNHEWLARTHRHRDNCRNCKVLVLSCSSTDRNQWKSCRSRRSRMHLYRWKSNIRRQKFRKNCSTNLQWDCFDRNTSRSSNFSSMLCNSLKLNMICIEDVQWETLIGYSP